MSNATTSPHDDRCEAHWNDGICACPERAEPRLTLHRPEPVTLIARIVRAFKIY